MSEHEARLDVCEESNAADRLTKSMLMDNPPNTQWPAQMTVPSNQFHQMDEPSFNGIASEAFLTDKSTFLSPQLSPNEMLQLQEGILVHWPKASSSLQLENLSPPFVSMKRKNSTQFNVVFSKETVRIAEARGIRFYMGCRLNQGTSFNSKPIAVCPWHANVAEPMNVTVNKAAVPKHAMVEILDPVSQLKENRIKYEIGCSCDSKCFDAWATEKESGLSNHNSSVSVYKTTSRVCIQFFFALSFAGCPELHPVQTQSIFGFSLSQRGTQVINKLSRDYEAGYCAYQVEEVGQRKEKLLSIGLGKLENEVILALNKTMRKMQSYQKRMLFDEIGGKIGKLLMETLNDDNLKKEIEHKRPIPSQKRKRQASPSIAKDGSSKRKIAKFSQLEK